MSEWISFLFGYRGIRGARFAKQTPLLKTRDTYLIIPWGYLCQRASLTSFLLGGFQIIINLFLFYVDVLDMSSIYLFSLFIVWNYLTLYIISLECAYLISFLSGLFNMCLIDPHSIWTCGFVILYFCCSLGCLNFLNVCLFYLDVLECS